MILFSYTITPRLRYIADFIGKEISGQPINLTSDQGNFREYKGAKINYSSEKIADDEFRITPHSLLFEKNISSQQTDCFIWNDRKAFFKTEGDFPFDIFAASFYLLSRYEEYLPYQKDIYGRYAHENSLAYKEDFMNRPLVNIWLKDFTESIKEKSPSFTPDSYRDYVSRFMFLPTYDIDMAWSYRHKGWWRNFGGIIKSFIKNDLQQLKERINVLKGKQQDPFDAYSWMNQLHEKYKLKPYYFFLVAGKNGRHDKNISPGKKAMKDLIYDHAMNYPVGIHPSWRSGDEVSLLKKEINTLAMITGSAIYSSRQHYIRFTLPETFQRLINNGIQFDFSMGYGSINGFRASVASPFYWYDLPNEKQADLLLFPFCFMEANSFYEQKYTARQALDEMRYYYNAIKSVSGTFIMIWHNSFLGTGKLFTGWREIYEQFIKEVSA